MEELLACIAEHLGSKEETSEGVEDGNGEHDEEEETGRGENEEEEAGEPHVQGEEQVVEREEEELVMDGRYESVKDGDDEEED